VPILTLGFGSKAISIYQGGAADAQAVSRQLSQPSQLQKLDDILASYYNALAVRIAMTGYIIAIVCGLIFLVATFHPQLGPRVYRTAWPGYYSDPRQRRTAIVQCLLLGIACILVGMVVFLQSFHNDFWTIVSLALLAVCASCVVAALVIARLLQRVR